MIIVKKKKKRKKEKVHIIQQRPYFEKTLKDWKGLVRAYKS